MTAALAALRAVTFKQPVNCSKALEVGAIEAVIHACKSAEDNDKLCAEGVWCLLTLCAKAPMNAECAKANGGLQLVTALSARHPGCRKNATFLKALFA